MAKRQKEVIFSGKREDAEGCILDTEVPATAFYNALFHDILEGKFTEINNKLYRSLVKHNNIQG